MNEINSGGARSATAHISPLGAWALAFGCAIGWDAFVMPWLVFLPSAGPLGTVVGVIIGGVIMTVIAWNYFFMIGRRPGPGGAYTYATAAFGHDHGFLCAWFLCFAYVAIIWMDAAVLAYFIQHAWGLDFMGSFHYSVAGKDVSIIHIVLSTAAIAYAAAVCTRRRLAVQMQTVLSTVLAYGIVVCFIAAIARHKGGFASMAPAMAEGGGSLFTQIFGIVALSPWLFVGFESISHSSTEFKFHRSQSFSIMAWALGAIVMAYVFLSLVPALVPNYTPGGHFTCWPEAVAHAVANMGDSNDIVFGAIGRSLHFGGRHAISVLFFAAIFTNLIGNTIAASRLLAAMGDDGALPSWFGVRNSDGAPRNAVVAISVVSLIIFAIGESIVGIVEDLALVGAAIAYAYTSAAAFKTACFAGNRLTAATGVVGLTLSAAIFALFVLPNFSENAASMGTVSYLVLVVWCIVGLVIFLSVFRRDNTRRFGQSPVVWLALSAIIVFLSVLWVRQATIGKAKESFDEIAAFHDELCPSPELADKLRENIQERQQSITKSFLETNYVQTGLTVLSLALMLYFFFIFRMREREREKEKERAKSLFFSTVSHDIRTPLNAILGFSEMLRDGFSTEGERNQAIDSILMSGKTLLALVNDILDLSKLESGKMEIAVEPTDCRHLLREVMEVFRVTKAKPGVEFRVSVGEMPDLMLDPQRLRQIVFNLVGNAVKFTEQGYIELRATYDLEKGSRTGVFRMEVEDTGCGISQEDLKRIASAYVQVGSKSGRAGGTGLGLAICKQLAKAMGGEFHVASTLGRGSTFSVVLRGVAVAGGSALQDSPSAGRDGPALQDYRSAGASSPATPACADSRSAGASSPASPASVDSRFAAEHPIRRILIVDDSRINLTILHSLLRKAGTFEIVTAADGNEALAALKAPGAAFDLVLTDLWMPNLDGEGLVRAIRSDPALARLKVVIVTADVELRTQYAAKGFDAILLKPITTATLGKFLADLAKGNSK